MAKHYPEHIGGLLAGPVKPDMTQKHTPGPWVLRDRVMVVRIQCPGDGSYNEPWREWAELGIDGARCHEGIPIVGFVNMSVVGNDDMATGQANAERIVACVNGCKDIKAPAAVPELIEALECMLEHSLSDNDELDMQTGQRARAALAAAKAAPGPGGEQE